MRLSKFQVVALIFACLLTAGSAQAQFGKLKSLAKDKLGSQAKDSATQAAGHFGEAKAAYAPGVQKGKSLDVPRQHGGTGEASSRQQSASGAAPVASIAAIQGGISQDVTIKISRGDARQFDLVRGYSPCNKIKGFQILSPTQAKVTIDLAGNTASGTCSLSFVSGGNTIFSTNVSIKAKK